MQTACHDDQRFLTRMVEFFLRLTVALRKPETFRKYHTEKR